MKKENIKNPFAWEEAQETIRLMKEKSKDCKSKEKIWNKLLRGNKAAIAKSLLNSGMQTSAAVLSKNLFSELKKQSLLNKRPSLIKETLESLLSPHFKLPSDIIEIQHCLLAIQCFYDVIAQMLENDSILEKIIDRAFLGIVMQLIFGNFELENSFKFRKIGKTGANHSAKIRTRKAEQRKDEFCRLYNGMVKEDPKRAKNTPAYGSSFWTVEFEEHLKKNNPDLLINTLDKQVRSYLKEIRGT